MVHWAPSQGPSSGVPGALLRDDWTRRPREEASRTKASLVPWDDLSEDVKELNRDMVRSLPASLARVGLRVVRTEHPEPPDPA